MFDVLETVKSYREPLSSLAALKLRSMSSIKRDVKKKSSPRPEDEVLSRDPAHSVSFP